VGFFLGGGFLPFVYNNDDSKRLSLVKYIIDVEHRDKNNFPTGCFVCIDTFYNTMVFSINPPTGKEV
jgi:hypothetical protein